MSVSESFLTAVREALAFVPDYRERKMFGAVGVYTGDRMFAIADDDALYLKGDAQNRAAFEAAGSGLFVYAVEDGVEKTLNYWRAPEAVFDDPQEARLWAGLGIEAALRAARPKGRKGAVASPQDVGPGPWSEP